MLGQAREEQLVGVLGARRRIQTSKRVDRATAARKTGASRIYVPDDLDVAWYARWGTPALQSIFCDIRVDFSPISPIFTDLYVVP